MVVSLLVIYICVAVGIALGLCVAAVLAGNGTPSPVERIESIVQVLHKRYPDDPSVRSVANEIVHALE